MKHITLLLAIAITTGTHAQIIFQNDFESWTGGLPDSWVGAKTNISLDSISQVTTNVQLGASACRLNNPGTTHKRFTTGSVTVTSCTAYEIKFWVRGSGEVRTGLYDGRASGSGYAAYNAYAIAAATWAEVTQTITAAHDTTDAEFIISVRNSLGAEHIVIDNVTITSLSVSVPASIHDIQYTTAADGISPLLGATVQTGGIVTAHYSGGYWIQNGSGPWSGIYVTDSLTTVADGDSLTLQAVVEENFSLTRLVCPGGVLVEGGYPVPAASVISNATAQLEDYESVLVTAQYVTCTVEDAGFGEWVVNDGANDSLIVDDLIYAFSPTLGSVYTLTGPMYYAFNDRKIEPRSASDVVIGMADLEAINISISPNPASDAITIQREAGGMAQVELVDATGRVVLTDHTADARITIDVRALNTGIYTLVLNENGSLRAGRVAIGR